MEKISVAEGIHQVWWDHGRETGQKIEDGTGQLRKELRAIGNAGRCMTTR